MSVSIGSRSQSAGLVSNHGKHLAELLRLFIIPCGIVHSCHLPRSGPQGCSVQEHRLFVTCIGVFLIPLDCVLERGLLLRISVCEPVLAEAMSLASAHGVRKPWKCCSIPLLPAVDAFLMSLFRVPRPAWQRALPS